MRLTGFLVVPLTALAFALAGCGASGGAPATSERRTDSAQRIGDENHPRILAQYGGAYRNEKLAAYVDELGRKLAAVTEQPQAKWTFTVLDTPTVNAFALPGGYVYVTRGLVALADDEAELAGVIGHEIGHVTAGHSALRQERGTVAGIGLLLGSVALAAAGIDDRAARGVLKLGEVAAGGILAGHSRSDELDADNLGIRYIARAGYDPYAQADFLDSMSDASALDSRIAGRAYDPESFDFFASHPANAPRTRKAIDVARDEGLAVREDATRNRDRFLDAVDGMTYGQNPDQGVVDGRDFSHPKLRFAYTAPPGFALTNTDDAVIARGPDKALFVMDGDGASGRDLTDYIDRDWKPELAKQMRLGRFRELRQTRINGLDAAYGTLPARTRDGAFDGLLVAVRMDETIYRFTGLAPQGSGGTGRMLDAARTFRRLSQSEADEIAARRIEIATVREGDTVAALAERMNVSGFEEDRFRLLNGLDPGDPLRPGDRVKLIR